MRRFKLIIIGDANHQYIINFSKWLRIVFQDLSIKIISFHPIKNKTIAKTYFNDCFEVPVNSKVMSKLVIFRTLYLGWKLLHVVKKNKLTANTILVHYVQPQLAFIGHSLKKRTSNYILALWGSDYYRAKTKHFLKNNLKHADNIIIGSPQMIQDFKKEYENQISKVHLCYYGNEPIENLEEFKKLSVTKQQSCDFFNLTNSKINISIGHNGSKSHQHIQILKELMQLKHCVKEKIRIILPMTYGLDEEYLNEIKIICEKCSFEYKILTSYLNDLGVAHLRNITDIMVNLQTTDAFSGSMREVLYCGGVVINGSWLPYQFLKEMDVYFEEVGSIHEISGKISEIILDYYSYRNRCEGNPEKIYNISSWSQTILKWKEVIKQQR